MVDIVCAGPGPHVPDDGILGQSSVPPVKPCYCPAAPCQAQFVAAGAAQLTSVTNQATIQANIQTHLGQLETWLQANPNGAVLTAAQTKFLAQMLVGVGRIMLGLTSTVGQAN